MLDKRKVVKYILIVVVMKIVGFSLFFMYSSGEEIKKEGEHKKLKIHPMQTVSVPKKEIFSKEELQQQKNSLMQWRLEQKMKNIYASSLLTYDKKKKKKTNMEALIKHLDGFKDTDIFVADFYEKTVYGSNDYKDINARTIVLEEIQKVRRKGGGYIVSNINERGSIRYLLVKDLKFLNLYIGINIIE